MAKENREDTESLGPTARCLTCGYLLRRRTPAPVNGRVVTLPRRDRQSNPRPPDRKSDSQAVALLRRLPTKYHCCLLCHRQPNDDIKRSYTVLLACRLRCDAFYSYGYYRTLTANPRIFSMDAGVAQAFLRPRSYVIIISKTRREGYCLMWLSSMSVSPTIDWGISFPGSRGDTVLLRQA